MLPIQQTLNTEPMTKAGQSLLGSEPGRHGVLSVYVTQRLKSYWKDNSGDFKRGEITKFCYC